MANFYKKSSQLGRSMIEMLGVLAIIGVLSIAGIAGYTKAMEKWRINKTIDQITTTVAALRTVFINEKNYEQLGYSSSYADAKRLRDLGIISDDMLSDKPVRGQDGVNSYIVNPFKGGYWINGDGDVRANKRPFIVALSGLHKNECMYLAANDWSQLGVSGLIVNGNDGDNISMSTLCVDFPDGLVEDETVVGCPNGRNIPLPIPPHLAAAACGTCNQYSAGCSLGLWFLD